jgi:hypothetical protein
VKFSVPYIVTVTEIYEVEAKTGYDAAEKAGQERAKGTKPTSSHESGRKLGSIHQTADADA